MPQIPVRELTSSFQQRYSNTGRSLHTNFSEGMIRDIASWEAPEGACWDAVDMLCDYEGKIRKRGGTTSPAAGNSAATVENLASFKSNGVDGLTGVLGSSGKSGAITLFNTSTGATTALQASLPAATFACRPFQHRNLMVLPMQMLGTTTNDTNKNFYWGGGTASLSLTNGVMNAGDNRITSITPASITASMLGSILSCTDGVSLEYIGRIVEVTSTSAVRVEPTPTISMTSFDVTGNHIQSIWAASQLTTIANLGDVTGRFGASFQGRIVLGDTVFTPSTSASTYVGGIDRKPRRIWWSQLATEAIPLQGAGFTIDGEAILAPGAFTFTPNPSGAGNNVQTFNWVDIDGLQTMTGLAAVGDGSLLIFGPQQMFRLTGQLSTETEANPDLPWSVDQVSNNVGCIAGAGGRDSRSIQYAQGGLIFAGPSNIYLYDGSSLKPLLQGRNARYYQDRLRAGDRPVGSAYSVSRNHYYLSMNGSDTSGLMINLDTLAMTRFTNVQLFDSCPDPTDATKLWGVRWWDVTGAAPTMTKGQLIGLESIWLPTQTNASDADGTAVLNVLQTKSYGAGELSVNKRPTDVQLTYDMRGTGSPTATFSVDTKLNTPDASYATITATLPNTGAATGTFGARILPLVAEGPAVEFKYAQNAACASCEILGIDIGMQQDSVI